MTGMQAEELDQCFSSHGTRIHPVWNLLLLSTFIPTAPLLSKGVLTNLTKAQVAGKLHLWHLWYIRDWEREFWAMIARANLKGKEKEK